VNLDRLSRAPNLAIIGSSSPVGKELKDLIQDSPLPVGKVKLLDTEGYAGLLQEFAGQIEVTQIISPAALKDTDIAFFACGPEIMNSYAATGAGFPDVSIDLTQTGRAGTIFLKGLSDSSLVRTVRDSGYFINPHPSVIVLANVLNLLNRNFKVESSTVTILEPASERGATAIEELQEQTVRLLNFQSVGSKQFKGQIAFNLLPETEAAVLTEGIVRKQLAAILGDTIPLPALMTIQAPVFHSEAFSMFVRFATTSVAPTAEDIRKCLVDSKAAVVNVDPEDAPSPVSVIGSDAIHVGRIAADPHDPSLFGFWMIADNLRIAAANALGIAESIVLAAATTHR
jgi:aspartate-semialdehyde dehydrogenase